MSVIEITASDSSPLGLNQMESVVREACDASGFQGQKALMIVPDATRTAPVGDMFKCIHRALKDTAARLDVMIALGTHHPMSEEAICRRLDLTLEERRSEYSQVQFFNHEWDNPDALAHIGDIGADEIHELTGGLFSMDVPVSVNKRLFEYDRLIIVGPVFPHEVVGFSGGNKYLFPGVSGPEVLNFFHWLGAVVSNPKIIGHKWTPVRKVVDKAGGMVPVPKLCFAMVMKGTELAGLYAGGPEEAWDRASDHSARLNIVHKPRAFHTILSCAPPMYEELWTGGKAMYKLEPVLADGGELIIYAPHINEVCFTHGKILHEIGYHCRDYYLKQWDRFQSYPWGVLAHSCHVYGQGAYDNGVEAPRARVTLATGIPEEVCRKINLGYLDPAAVDPSKYQDREEEGVLYVPKAGEQLFKLDNPPEWARVAHAKA